MKAADNFQHATQWASLQLKQLTKNRILVAVLLAVLFSAIESSAQNCNFSADEIVGPTDICALANSAGVVSYSVKAVDASGYKWTIPVQAVLVSGQGTSTISLRYKRAFAYGMVSVAIQNACGGDSLTRTLTVTKTLPAPEAVDGAQIVCEQADAGTPVTYTVTPVANATQYTWTMSPGMTLVSGQGTTSIQVLYAPTFTSGFVKVRAVAACARSTNFSYAVTAKGPAVPSFIMGPTRGICSPNNVAEYNINPVQFATSYAWTVDVPGAIIDNQGTKAIITFPSFMSTIVRVSAVGTCGTSGQRWLRVFSKGTDPVVINGPDSVCQGTVQTFSTNAFAAATSYEWTVPVGSVIQSGAGTPTITVLVGPQSGAVSVKVVTNCDPGTPVSSELVVTECEVEVPPTPTCEVDVYPIPTAGLLHVKFKVSGTGQYHVNVTNPQTGCTVFSSCGPYQCGINEISLDLSGLRDGGYIFNLVAGDLRHNQRIEIKH